LEIKLLLVSIFSKVAFSKFSFQLTTSILIFLSNIKILIYLFLHNFLVKFQAHNKTIFSKKNHIKISITLKSYIYLDHTIILYYVFFFGTQVQIILYPQAMNWGEEKRYVKKMYMMMEQIKSKPLPWLTLVCKWFWIISI
jgi:hypothetical protein